jgi:hypothetical protein
MRTQYHFRQSPQGLRAWSVHRLVEISSPPAARTRTLSAIRELDEPYWSGESTKSITCRQIVEHARLIRDCGFAFPVILSSDGRVMDGMHRICKALFEGLSDIEAVRLIQDPEPDYVGLLPDDLPYDD